MTPQGQPGLPRTMHCRNPQHHTTHLWAGGNLHEGPLECPGGPWTAPGTANRQPQADQTVVDVLAAVWRRGQAQQIGASQRTLMDDSYRFARDAVDALKRAGVELMMVSGPDDVVAPPAPGGGWQPGTT